MAKKKKGGSKKKGSKKKKGGDDDSAPPTRLYDQYNAHEIELLKAIEGKTDWVHLEVKLFQWGHSNFSVCLRQKTPLSTIVRKIADRHGRLTDLRLYRSPPGPNPADDKNIFTEEELQLSLAAHGYVGGPKEDDEEKYTIFYDFKPALSCPLLLKEPQLLLPDDEKVTMADDAAAADAAHADAE